MPHPITDLSLFDRPLTEIPALTSAVKHALVHGHRETGAMLESIEAVVINQLQNGTEETAESTLETIGIMIRLAIRQHGKVTTFVGELKPVN